MPPRDIWREQIGGPFVNTAVARNYVLVELRRVVGTFAVAPCIEPSIAAATKLGVTYHPLDHGKRRMRELPAQRQIVGLNLKLDNLERCLRLACLQLAVAAHLLFFLY